VPKNKKHRVKKRHNTSPRAQFISTISPREEAHFKFQLPLSRLPCFFSNFHNPFRIQLKCPVDHLPAHRLRVLMLANWRIMKQKHSQRDYISLVLICGAWTMKNSQEWPSQEVFENKSAEHNTAIIIIAGATSPPGI